MSQYPLVLTMITAVGAVYLLYLGIALLVTRRGSGTTPSGAASAEPVVATIHTPSAVRGTSTALRITRGIGVSVLNPKGVLVFVALLPQFASRSAAWPLAVQLAVLGMLFASTCAVFYAMLRVSARAIVGARPGVARAISRVSGIAMIVIGFALMIERVVQLGPS